MNIPNRKHDTLVTELLQGWDYNGFRDNAKAIWLVTYTNWWLNNLQQADLWI